MRAFAFLLAVATLSGNALARGIRAKGLDLRTLPAAVRVAIEANLKSGEIKKISKEKEEGVEQYEVESVLNGKERDLGIDSKGVLLVVEEATTLDAIPAAARAGILRKSGSGRIDSVETFSKPGQPLMYEAVCRTRAGKKHEVLAKADGTGTTE